MQTKRTPLQVSNTIHFILLKSVLFTYKITSHSFKFLSTKSSFVPNSLQLLLSMQVEFFQMESSSRILTYNIFKVYNQDSYKIEME